MNGWEILLRVVLYGFLLPIMVSFAVRLIFGAFYSAKLDYESKKIGLDIAAKNPEILKETKGG